MKIENLGISVDMKTLVGKHLLSGVDESSVVIERWGDLENCQCLNFILDDLTYTAVEDPNDGYRSSMDALIVSGKKLTNTFDPIEVIVSYADKKVGSWGNDKCDILEFIDAKNGKKVLEVGTGDTDDYYPYFVASWMPENLSVNSA